MQGKGADTLHPQKPGTPSQAVGKASAAKGSECCHSGRTRLPPSRAPRRLDIGTLVLPTAAQEAWADEWILRRDASFLTTKWSPGLYKRGSFSLNSFTL